MGGCGHSMRMTRLVGIPDVRNCLGYEFELYHDSASRFSLPGQSVVKKDESFKMLTSNVFVSFLFPATCHSQTNNRILPYGKRVHFDEEVASRSVLSGKAIPWKRFC